MIYILFSSNFMDFALQTATGRNLLAGTRPTWSAQWADFLSRFLLFVEPFS